MRTHSLIQIVARLILCLLVLLVTGSLAADENTTPLSLNDARHLLMRTGFGASPTDINQLTGKSRADAVATIIEGLNDQPATTPPAWTNKPAPHHFRFPDLTTEEKQNFRQARLVEVQSLRRWWIREMISTPSPQTERLTLFWHNHFATAYSGVTNQSISIARQHMMLRENSAGNFRDLLKNIIRDPAMLNYLDNNNSKKQKPNENLAREIMELFTLGEGSYSEADIKNAARALTGYSYSEMYDMRFVFKGWNHDTDSKTIFGETGNFNGDDLVDLILEQSNASRYLTVKFWRMLVGEVNKSDEILTSHAEAFRQSDYDIKTLYKNILLSDAFWHPDNRASIVKSPVSLTIGAIRSTGILPLDWQTLSAQLQQMGQHLFEPPNVAGWQGGATWIAPGRLLARLEWLERFESQTTAPLSESMMGEATMAMAAPSPTQNINDNINDNSMQQSSNSMMSDDDDNTPTKHLLSIRMASEEFDEQVEYKVRAYGLNNSVWDSGVRKLNGGHDTKRMGRIDKTNMPWQTINFSGKLATTEITAIEISFINDGTTPDGADRNLYISRAWQGSRVWLPSDGNQTGKCPRNKPQQRGNIYCPGTLRMEKSFIPAAQIPTPLTTNTLRVSGVTISSAQPANRKPHSDLVYTLSDVEFEGRTWNSLNVKYVKHKDGHSLRLSTTGCWPECVIEWPECAWVDKMHNMTISLELEKNDQHCMYKELQNSDKKLVRALWMLSDDLHKAASNTRKTERPGLGRNHKQWTRVIRIIQNRLTNTPFHDDAIKFELIPKTIVDTTLGEQPVEPLPAGQTADSRDNSLNRLLQHNPDINLATLLLPSIPADNISKNNATLTEIITDLSFQLH